MRLLELTGVVKFENKKSNIFYFSSVISATFMSFTILAMWLYAFEDHPFFDKTLSFEAIISTFYASGKLLNIRLRAREFTSIVQDTTTLWKEMQTDARNLEILEQEKYVFDEMFLV